MRRWLNIILLLFLLSSITIAYAAPNAIGEVPPEYPLYATVLIIDGETRDTFSIVRLDDPFSDAEPTFVTADNANDDFDPLPSFDGRYLLFFRDASNSVGYEFHLIDFDCHPDCPPRPLPDEAQELQDIHWSPTAAQFVGWGPQNNAWVFDVETWTLNRIAPGSWTAYPTWSPDGSHMIVVSDMRPFPDAMFTDDIQLVIPADDSFVGGDYTNNTLVNLTYTNSFIEDQRPRYSPDGRWIAQTTRSLTGQTDIPFVDSPNGLLLMDAGCILEDDVSAACTANRRLLSGRGHTIDQYSWSPDSHYIAYIEIESVNALGEAGDLWLVEVATGETRQFTSGRNTFTIAWSPDSSALVVDMFRAGQVILELHRLDGSEPPRRLLENYYGAAMPHWAPDF